MSISVHLNVLTLVLILTLRDSRSGTQSNAATLLLQLRIWVIGLVIIYRCVMCSEAVGAV